MLYLASSPVSDYPGRVFAGDGSAILGRHGVVNLHPDPHVSGNKQDAAGWGARVIDRLAGDLRDGFPDMKGFSPRNLKYMRAYPSSPQTVLKVLRKSGTRRLWYIPFKLTWT